MLSTIFKKAKTKYVMLLGRDPVTGRGEVAAILANVAAAAALETERGAAVGLEIERQTDPGVGPANQEVSQMTGKKTAAPKVDLGRRRKQARPGEFLIVILKVMHFTIC